MGIKKPTRCPGSLSKQKKKQIPKCNMQPKGSSVKQAKSGKALIIAQEIKFARLLASKDKKVRDKVLKNLKKWLTVRSQSSFTFAEADFLRLWKGLFYCMWMSDKPLIQEELADSISKIVHCFHSLKTALLYIKCTFKSLASEWFGIDQYRIDKFEMLLRKIIRQTFEVCKKNEWNKDWVVEFAKILQEVLLDKRTSLGFKLHIIEVYMEELAKVSDGEINEEIVTELIRPFTFYLAELDDPRQIRHVVKNIFRYLIFQSDVGMDYLEKFNAWKKAGFPCGSIDNMVKFELTDADVNSSSVNHSSDEDNSINNSFEKPLDPRAGRVDVEIPQIPFDPQLISNLLLEYRFNPGSTTKARKNIMRLAKEFALMSQGQMPLGIKEVQVPSKKKLNSKKAAFDLLQFEKELYSDSNKIQNKGKRKFTEQIENISDDKSDKEKRKKLKANNILRVKDKNGIMKKNSRISVPGLTIPNGKLCKRKLKKKRNNFELTSGCWNVSSTNYSDTKEKSVTITPNSDELQRRKNLALSTLTESLKNSKLPTLRPVLTKLEDQNRQSSQTPENELVLTQNKKRVKIVLQKNTAQHTSEYFQQIRSSPAIPYDANRKPRAGVLKPSSLPSPINPFYKRSIK